MYHLYYSDLYTMMTHWRGTYTRNLQYYIAEQLLRIFILIRRKTLWFMLSSFNFFLKIFNKYCLTQLCLTENFIDDCWLLLRFKSNTSWDLSIANSAGVFFGTTVGIGLVALESVSVYFLNSSSGTIMLISSTSG